MRHRPVQGCSSPSCGAPSFFLRLPFPVFCLYELWFLFRGLQGRTSLYSLAFLLCSMKISINNRIHLSSPPRCCNLAFISRSEERRQAALFLLYRVYCLCVRTCVRKCVCNLLICVVKTKLCTPSWAANKNKTQSSLKKMTFTEYSTNTISEIRQYIYRAGIWHCEQYNTLENGCL